MITKFEGECHRAFLSERGEYDPLVIIETEDDGNWCDGMQFDIAWLPEFAKIISELMESPEAQKVLADIKSRIEAGTYYK